MALWVGLAHCLFQELDHLTMLSSFTGPLPVKPKNSPAFSFFKGQLPGLRPETNRSPGGGMHEQGEGAILTLGGISPLPGCGCLKRSLDGSVHCATTRCPNEIIVGCCSCPVKGADQRIVQPVCCKRMLFE